MVRRLGEHFDACAVHDGKAALQRLASGDEYDAILLDVHLPKLNGIDVYKQIRFLFPSMVKRMAFVSGGMFDHTEAEFLASVPNPKLAKPFAFATLRGIVELVGQPKRIAA
jgi:CheY-like chemotaxis protein